MVVIIYSHQHVLGISEESYETKIRHPEWKTEFRKLSTASYAYIQAEGSWGLSNAGLIIGDNSMVVVDTLNSTATAKVFFIEINRITTKKKKYIVLTHSHPDHVWGSLLIPGAVSLCHRNCYKEMTNMSHLSESQVPSGAQFDFSKALTSLDYLIFENATGLNLGKREIRLFHYGTAHTGGDAVVYFPEDGVVFCGDLVFLYSTPISIGGSFQGWIEAINKILEIDASIYVPGHGPVCDREGVMKCREYLMFVLEEARKAFNAGVPYREAAIRIQLKDFKNWVDTERILGNVKCIYRELNNEGPAPSSEAMESITEMRELA